MKKTALGITLLLILCVLLLSIIWSGFRSSLDTITLQEDSSTTYARHYVLIPEAENSILWQAIYEKANESARENNAYLELLSQDAPASYTTADYLRILIAAKVDGIILKPDGTEEVRELIDEAVEAGIPVVTVLEDDSDSQRVCYVGLNSYQLADVYTEIVSSLYNSENPEVLILMDSESVNPIRTLAAAQVTKNLSEEATVSYYYLESSADFDSEEGVREYFINTSSLPDVMICMDEVLTECVYQAMVDYNEVGHTSLVGFYYSDQILDAIEKGIVPVTLVLDTGQVGRYCIEALEEYHSLGHTSSYYSVDLSLITQENVSDFVDSDVEEEA